MVYARDEKISLREIRDIWRLLDTEERVSALGALPRQDADDIFMGLPAAEQGELVLALAASQQKSYVRLLAPDDVADLIQELPRQRRDHVLDLLDDRTRAEVIALLTYEEDAAGGLMNPRYVRLRPDMTAEEALFYLRRQAKESAETIYVAFVLDPSQQLLGAVSLREVLQAKLTERVSDFMQAPVLSVLADTPQEEVSRLFADHDLSVMPVLDQEGRMVGIVTIDDIVDVVQEEATEDIQRMAGVESLERPYPQTTFLQMMRKRAGWLTALFFSEMLTATALGYYEDEIKRLAEIRVRSRRH
jgi:magnesium transporter